MARVPQGYAKGTRWPTSNDASPLAIDGGVGASPAYLGQVLTAAEQLRKRNLIAGVLVYQVPFTGGTASSGARSRAIVSNSFLRLG